MAIVHELSWSTSRARNFAECRRRYYFDYYLSWRGWGRDAEPERRRVYLLKKMTRMPMLAGDIVHRAIAEYYARRDQGLGWSAEEATDWAVQELRRGYKESRDGAWKARPAKSVRLAEHHYEEPVVDESTDRAREYGTRYVERIRTSLETFFSSHRLAEAREAEPRDWLACEDMSTFELFDTKVFAVPDFAFLGRDDAGAEVVHIVDWKTGRPREADRFQLEVYAFYAREKWGTDPTRTVAADAYLLDDEVREVAVTEEILDGALERIEESIDEMRELHFDADRGSGDPDRFPRVPEADAARVCSRCNYRELCDRT